MASVTVEKQICVCVAPVTNRPKQTHLVFEMDRTAREVLRTREVSWREAWER
jgi:hypothetical protein